jgi:hypothetical protein
LAIHVTKSPYTDAVPTGSEEHVTASFPKKEDVTLSVVVTPAERGVAEAERQLNAKVVVAYGTT